MRTFAVDDTHQVQLIHSKEKKGLGWFCMMSGGCLKSYVDYRNDSTGIIKPERRD